MATCRAYLVANTIFCLDYCFRGNLIATDGRSGMAENCILKVEDGTKGRAELWSASILVFLVLIVTPRISLFPMATDS